MRKAAFEVSYCDRHLCWLSLNIRPSLVFRHHPHKYFGIVFAETEVTVRLMTVIATPVVDAITRAKND